MGATTANTTLMTTTRISWAKPLWNGNHPGSLIARIPIITFFFTRSVPLWRIRKRSRDCTMLKARYNSTPRPRNVFIVTRVTKKDDMRSSELPSISNAASGFSKMIANVSKNWTGNRSDQKHVEHLEQKIARERVHLYFTESNQPLSLCNLHENLVVAAAEWWSNK